MSEAIELIEDDDQDSEPIEVADKVPGLIPLNSDETYGVVVGRRFCTLYVRKLYAEDTEIQFPLKGGGMSSKWYFAGQHGPWMLSDRPYPFDLLSVLKIVYQWMILDGLQEASDFAFFLEVLDKKFDDLETVLSAIAPSTFKPKAKGKKKK